MNDDDDKTLNIDMRDVLKLRKTTYNIFFTALPAS
jgi:hypothetical protein